MLKFVGHGGEICGLDFSKSQEYFASGGNDDKMLVWSVKMSKFIFKGEHKGGVRGIAFSRKSPHIVYSGGGQGDNMLKQWNTINHSLINQ